MRNPQTLSCLVAKGILARGAAGLLGGMSTTALAAPVSAEPVSVGHAVAVPDGSLECSTYVSGPNGVAECNGEDTSWRLALYCDLPSPSPVYGMTQYGDGVSSASCWFGRPAQYAAVESW